MPQSVHPFADISPVAPGVVRPGDIVYFLRIRVAPNSIKSNHGRFAAADRA
jgi:hypothetical protein